MTNVALVGVGALGRHHLTGLLSSRAPFSILVVDPSERALALAKESAAHASVEHAVSFVQEIPEGANVDLAIVATTSAHRAAAVEALVGRSGSVRNLILEKILFDRKDDYKKISDLLKEHKVSAWVNHPRRLYPFHRTLKEGAEHPLYCHAAGGARYGLMTSVLHYADYFAYLNGSYEFETDTSLLAPEAVPSKREGYLELFGTLSFTWKNGSWGAVTSLPQEGPFRIALASPSMRAELRESEGAASVSRKTAKWAWEEHKAPLLKQSEMTGGIAAEILESGTCDLTSYDDASRVHLQVLEPVREFLCRTTGKTVDTYPFT